MANLIPTHVEQTIKREYTARVAAVWLFLIAAGLAVFLLLLVPVYVLIESQADAYTGAYVEAEGKSSEFGTISSTISETNALALMLLEHERDISISTYFALVTAEENTDVTLSLFNFRGGTEPIIIGGVAENRNQLVTYKTALEETGLFERVELPISSLASEQDIQFTMQLFLKQAAE